MLQLLSPDSDGSGSWPDPLGPLRAILILIIVLELVKHSGC
jgi:hypothetical protein